MASVAEAAECRFLIYKRRTNDMDELHYSAIQLNRGEEGLEVCKGSLLEEMRYNAPNLMVCKWQPMPLQSFLVSCE
jgi:hypothetical protein